MNTLASPILEVPASSFVAAARNVLSRRTESPVAEMDRRDGSGWSGSGDAEPLTRVEERRLVDRAQRGDKMSRERLVAAHSRLVWSVARRYRCRTHSTEDLAQEGMLGLMLAIDRFDATRDCRLSTYALHWIRQAIARAASQTDRMIHVPAQATAEIRRMRRVRDERQQVLGRELSDGELANECGVDEARVARLFAALQDAVSYDTPVGEGQEASLLELAEDQSAPNPEAGALRESYRAEVRRLVAELRPRERDVLIQRFGMNGCSPRTLDELSRELRITREGVRQIEARAIRKLRHALRNAHWD